jgi:hypothetical protein
MFECLKAIEFQMLKQLCIVEKIAYADKKAVS